MESCAGSELRRTTHHFRTIVTNILQTLLKKRTSIWNLIQIHSWVLWVEVFCWVSQRLSQFAGLGFTIEGYRSWFFHVWDFGFHSVAEVCCFWLSYAVPLVGSSLQTLHGIFDTIAIDIWFFLVSVPKSIVVCQYGIIIGESLASLLQHIGARVGLGESTSSTLNLLPLRSTLSILLPMIFGHRKVLVL